MEVFIERNEFCDMNVDLELAKKFIMKMTLQIGPKHVAAVII